MKNVSIPKPRPTGAQGQTRLEEVSLFSAGLALLVMTILYVPLVASTAGRPLWHDELFTLYMSRFSSFAELINEIRTIDLNPPLIYIVTRGFSMIIGDSELAIRLPSILAFWVASSCLLLFVARRLNAWYGLLAVIVFWYCRSLILATEARPYALLLMFMGLAMVSWQEAASRSRYRKPALVILPFALIGMIATHCFSVFYFLPFACAEAARLIQTRKADILLWTEFVFCGCTAFFYIPLVNRFGGAVFPAVFSASLHKMLYFFAGLFYEIWAPLLAASVGVLCFVAWRGKSKQPGNIIPAYSDFGLMFGLLIIPIAINVVLMKTHAAFWPRYAVGSGIAVGICFAWLVSWYARRATAPALVAAFLVLAVSYFTSGLTVTESTVNKLDPASLEAIKANLPIVAASGLTFLELDHYGSAALASRLYYLTDPVASIHYAHANLFEGMGALKQYFPIRATISLYSNFVDRHSRFLVLGTPGYPEDWLLPKLRDDGAALTPVSHYPSPWGSQIIVYYVETPGEELTKSARL